MIQEELPREIEEIFWESGVGVALRSAYLVRANARVGSREPLNGYQQQPRFYYPCAAV